MDWLSSCFQCFSSTAEIMTTQHYRNLSSLVLLLLLLIHHHQNTEDSHKHDTFKTIKSHNMNTFHIYYTHLFHSFEQWILPVKHLHWCNLVIICAPKKKFSFILQMFLAEEKEIYLSCRSKAIVSTMDVSFQVIIT